MLSLSTVSLVLLAGLPPVAAPVPESKVVEKLPPGAKVTALEVWPGPITLNNKFSYAQVLVNAKLSTGDTVDVTRMVRFDLPPQVKINDHGLVRPLSLIHV